MTIYQLINLVAYIYPILPCVYRTDIRSYQASLNPFHPKLLCAKSGWYWPSGSREEYSNTLSMYFCYLVIISLGTNLSLLLSRMLCAKFSWNWPGNSGEKGENVKSLQTDRCMTAYQKSLLCKGLNF